MSEFEDKSEISKDNKVFCSYFWSHLCIRSNDKVIPCCSYKNHKQRVDLKDYIEDSKLNIQTLINSDLAKEFRRKALNNQKVEGCKTCYFREEKANGRSLRNFANNTSYKPGFNSEESSTENISYLEIFISNKCNLKCLICAPDLSTPLAKDYFDLGLIEESDTKLKTRDYSSIANDLPSLKRIKFVGGEPLLDKNHLKLIESFSKEQAAEMTLEYATNCTVFPNEDILGVWSKYKIVNVVMSLDGAGKCAEYSRYPSKWDKVKTVAHKYKALANQYPTKIDLGINCSLSSLTVFDFNFLESFVNDELGSLESPTEGDLFFVNSVSFPEFFSIKHLPLETKSKLLEKYEENHRTSFFRAMLKSEGNPNELKKLKSFLNAMDRIRGTSLKDSVPELYDILEDIEEDHSWPQYLGGDYKDLVLS